MNLDQWQQLSNTTVSFVTVVAILVGGGFTLIEYYSNKEDNRQSHSLKLVSEYHSEDVRNHRDKLDAAWELGHPLLVSTLKKSSDKAGAFNNFVTALIEEEDLSRSVDHVMDFYERVVACVDTSLCDKKIVNRFFLRNGRTFFRKHYPYVCILRSKWNDTSIWSRTEKYFNPGSVGEICT